MAKNVRKTPKKRESDPANWLRSMRLSGVSIMIVGIMVLALIVLAPGVKTLVEQRQKIADAQAQVDRDKKDVQNLKDETARWNDPVYIRAQARERLFYVMPGETPYIVRNAANPETGAAKTASRTVTRTETDWTMQLLGSVLTAGLSDKPEKQLPSAGNPVPSSSPTPTPTTSKKSSR